MNVFEDVAILEDCKNWQQSFGEICVGCNKCGRLNKKEEEV